jgi:hypothetical protein
LPASSSSTTVPGGAAFGGVNTAGIFFAQERDDFYKPTGRLFANREYRAGDRSVAEHLPSDEETFRFSKHREV